MKYYVIITHQRKCGRLCLRPGEKPEYLSKSQRRAYNQKYTIGTLTRPAIALLTELALKAVVT